MACTHDHIHPCDVPAVRRCGCLARASDDVDALFARLRADDVEVVQEPIDQDYGIRDFAVRDPAGNLIRIQQVPRR